MLGSIFGGVSDELNMAMDLCEAASEFHTYNHQKQQNKGAFTLGKKNSLGGACAKGISADNDNKPEPSGAELNGFQNRYATQNQTRPAMGMRMAA